MSYHRLDQDTYGDRFSTNRRKMSFVDKIVPLKDDIKKQHPVVSYLNKHKTVHQVRKVKHY